MLEFCVVSSGSKANCIYVASATTRILIDCGLSTAQTVKRLASVGVSPDSISALLVSHEHRDHVAGIPVMTKKYDLNIYANEKTIRSSQQIQTVKNRRIVEFEAGGKFQVGDILVEPFSISHDAADPVAFRVTAGDVSLGVVTDLGYVTSLVSEQVRGLDALILESNHDLDLLQCCQYTWELKQRIASRTGHLSNVDAGTVVEQIASETNCRMKVLVAGHISENSNLAELATEGFRDSWTKIRSDYLPEIVAGSVYNPSRLYRLEAGCDIEQVITYQAVENF